MKLIKVKSLKSLVLFFSFFVLLPINLIASDYSTRSVYGGIGLIENPTARFDPDGEFTFGISTDKPYHRIYSTMQFLPWLEATLRYTEGTHTPYLSGGSQTWKDKGIDLKVRLLQESGRWPSVAAGFRDFGGTGAFSGEYIVASKRYSNVDFTLGMGWGTIASRGSIDNPVGWIIESQKIRGGGTSRGGTLNLKSLFSGEKVGFFGGLEYQTPLEGLSFKLEYDANDHSNILGRENIFFQSGDLITQDSRINFALDYSFPMSERDIVDLSIGMVRGNTIYANVSVGSNLNFVKERYTPPPEMLNKKTLQPFSDLNDGWQKYLTELIIWQMANEGFATHSLTFNDDEMIVEISQGRFLNTEYAIDLASRILANNSPKNINKYTVINFDQGIETIRGTVSSEELRKSVLSGPLEVELIDFNNPGSIKEGAFIRKNENLFPRFSWSLKPKMNGTLQHQIKFYFWQLEALLHTVYSFNRNLSITTDYGFDIANNFDEYSWHIPDGELHHVRQDRRLYLTEGESGLRTMRLDYLYDISPNIKASFAAGYLEWMYGGIGGEVLYSPSHRDWAVGLDAYWVKQRDFDQKFGFQDYETVTGFLTFYYDLPFYNLRLKNSVGKFLGKDKGMLIDLSRRFKTGAVVGAQVALTDCDSDCVGEGSFNKWIYFHLPMDLFYVQSSTRQKAPYSWSPLTKDAGTKVGAGSLYNLVMDAPDQVEALERSQWSIKKIFSGFGTKPKKDSA